MSYKVHQFYRVSTDILIEYKVKCLQRINSNDNGKSGRIYWFKRLDAIDCELNKRYNETYTKQDRGSDYANYFKQLNKQP